MINELYIENLAVIERASVQFVPGLNVFTGETGAGKSLLIGGINAILGARFSKDAVRAGTERAFVSARFNTDRDSFSESALELLRASGVTDTEDLILTREVTADGKSSAHINGRPVNAGVLRQVASELIDLHGQTDNRLLTSADRQREILDSYAGIKPLLSEYEAAFRGFQAISKRARQVAAELEAQSARMEELTLLLDELAPFNLQPGEEDDIASRLSFLRNAAFVNQSFLTALGCLSGGGDDQQGVISLLTYCRDALTNTGEFLESAQSAENEYNIHRLEEMLSELDDIRREVSRHYEQTSDFDEGEILLLEERLSVIRRFTRKQGCTYPELLNIINEWRNELANLQFESSEPQEIQKERERQGARVKELAELIHRARQKAAGELSAAVEEKLTNLNMPGTQMPIVVTKGKVTVTGFDQIEFLIAVNRGEEPKPMGKVASGGELSRIMLAVKAVLSESDNVATMIFDEIDAGISGRAANRVAEQLHAVSSNKQVICVTHLAQIAAKADRHLLIEKAAGADGRTYTKVYELDFDGRKRELARIIAGDENEAALLAANELMNN